MKQIVFFIGYIFLFTMCSAKVDSQDIYGLTWTWLENNQQEKAEEKLIFEEFFGDGNPLRLNQSMCIWQDKAFCFSHGSDCNVLDLKTKQWMLSDALPYSSHNNNAQFLISYYDQNDKYPLLLLSRGDYPPNQNDVYIIRVQEIDNHLTYTVIKTIHNNIEEARYNGSWVIDEEHHKLFLYTMTKGDWRVKEDNKFCVFSFPMPEITNTETVTLGYDDVISKWEYEYLILQGGTYFNGYLFFNVQSLSSINGQSLPFTNNVFAINAKSGIVEAVMPLYDEKETEGICVYKNKLYVTFKNGLEQQDLQSVVFSMREYSLPTMITKN